MTGKQILDGLSDSLMQDERILNAQERKLLASILQSAKSTSEGNPQVQAAIAAAISQAVGEAVGQRAFTMLGSAIVERILQEPTRTETTSSANSIYGFEPQPPGGQPQPPGGPPPRPIPRDVPAGPQPQPPGAPRPPVQPQPPGTGFMDPRRTVAVVDAPVVSSEQCVVLDEFLAPQELDELIRYAFEHEASFQTSEVISPLADGGVTDYEHRRSRVLMELGNQQAVITERIQAVLPRVLEKLGMSQFSVDTVEAQITASNDGDFFRCHSDNGDKKVASRRLTFAYFFHREPRAFEGGELLIHDSGGAPHGHGSFQSIEPRQNQIVLFPCSVMHEITPVKCPSGAFADSRFTLNGASRVNDGAWLEWMASLMGETSRRHNAADFPPGLFFCLLDELPLHLIPRRLHASLHSQSVDGAELFLNPKCLVLPGGQVPPGQDFLEGFAAQGTVAWVRGPATDFLLPFWLGPELREIIAGGIPGERLPGTLSVEERFLLRSSGILISQDYAERRRQQWQQALGNSCEVFRRKGYVPIGNLIHPFHVAALRRYYRYQIRCGMIQLGDPQSPRRHVAYNESVARFFHHQLVKPVSDIVGEPVKASYVYMASYLSGAALKKHTDREQCEFSVTLCLDFAPEPACETSWPICLDTPQGKVTVNQAIGDGLVYRGTQRPHYRDVLPEGRTSTSIFFHYVPAAFSGSLD